MLFRLLRALTLAFSLLAGTMAQAAPEPAQAPPGLAFATFAGGCFWCMVQPFEKLPGVVKVIAGYTGGDTPNPTYLDVSDGDTGHAEAVRITYDPAKITYEKLLDVYWVNVDPVDKGGQFCDRGSQYRPEIFVHTPEQRKAAETAKAALDASKKLQWPVVVKITDAGPFTAAEDYHQDYYLKNPSHYKRYRRGCGRDARLESLWGKASLSTH